MASNETKTERNSSLGEKDSTNDHDPRQLESGPKEEEIEYPSTRVVLPIVLSLCLAVFLTSLVRFQRTEYYMRELTNNRIVPSSALRSQPSQTTLNHLPTYHGTSLGICSPLEH